MIKPKFSRYLSSFQKNLALYNGFFWVKIRNLDDFFKTFNGRAFSEHIEDLERVYEQIKPPIELKKDFPSILKESNSIKEEIIKKISDIPKSKINFEEIKELYNLYIRAKTIDEKIQKTKENIENVESIRNKVDTFKDVYYNLMNDYIRNMVDYHFKNLNYENLLDFELINFYNYIFIEFDNYLFKSFKHILIRRPEIIKRKSIDLNQLNLIHKKLKMNLINEIVIENILHDLFYKNYEDIFKYAKDPLGLNIEIVNRDLSILNVYKQIKNQYSHGEGTINSLFLKKMQIYSLNFNDLGLSDISLGDKIRIDMDLIKQAENLIHKICWIIDKSMTSIYPDTIEDV